MEDKPNDPIAGQCATSPIGYVGVDCASAPPFPYAEELRTKDREDREKFHSQTKGAWNAPDAIDSRLCRSVEKMRAIGERDKFQGQTLLYQATALRALINSLPRILSPLAAEGLNVLLNRAGL